MPFRGAVELAHLAKERKVISNAQLGLADICAAVLHQRLEKPDHIRTGSDWSIRSLSREQTDYAARDAYASLLIFQRLSGMSVPSDIASNALPGTPLSLYHDDGQLIATGILSFASQKDQHEGANITRNRARITLQEIIVASAKISLHNNSTLASFGPAPFDIIAKRNKLKSRPVPIALDLDHSSNTPVETQPPLPQPVSDPRVLPELAEFLSGSHPADDWTGDIDDAPDIHDNDRDVTNPEVDERGVVLSAQMFPNNATSWPSVIRSRVLMVG